MHPSIVVVFHLREQGFVCMYYSCGPVLPDQILLILHFFLFSPLYTRTHLYYIYVCVVNNENKQMDYVW